MSSLIKFLTGVREAQLHNFPPRAGKIQPSTPSLGHCGAFADMPRSLHPVSRRRRVVQTQDAPQLCASRAYAGLLSHGVTVRSMSNSQKTP